MSSDPPSSGARAAPPSPFALPPPWVPTMSHKPGLGAETEVYYEWWNVDLVRRLHGS